MTSTIARAHVCLDCKRLPVQEQPKRVRAIVTKEGEPPRCHTHERERKAKVRDRSRELRWMKQYGITDEEYWELYRAQGEKCAFPRCRATGKRKLLAVDHDRALAVAVTEDHPLAHERDKGCRACIRGLLCGPHNYDLMGRFAVDLEDAIVYRDAPPARLVLAA